MARSAPADYREFIRLSVDLPMNPKLAMIDDPAAGWAYVVSLCYCGQNLTDGSFPMGPLLRLAGVEGQVAKMLIVAGLWHETGHTCDRCPQPMAGMGVVHDYLVHQRSADEAKALRDARREAGRRGAASRWSGNGDGKSHGNSHADVMANGQQTDGNSMAEVEVEVEEEKEQKKTSSSSSKPEPRRDDVDHLVVRLRTRLVENGFKVPDSFESWRRDARLLLDRDHRDLVAALELIDWSTSHHFWMANIRSMSKFRAQYDALAVQARNEYRKANTPRHDDRIAGWQQFKQQPQQQTGTEGRAALFAITGGDQS
jgi:hypothetical protein